MNTYTLKVASVKQETPDTITLCFKQPALKKIRYKAGQYLTLIFRINGRRYLRPYSFSSAPAVDAMLEVTVKRVPNGIVSNHIHDMIKPGDLVETMQPLGDFTFGYRENLDTVFLWGAGSGITPLISIAKQVLAEYTQVRVILIYGNRDKEATIFSDLISTLKVQYFERLKVWYFFTKQNISRENPFVIEGRIEEAHVQKIVKETDFKNPVHFICGPAGLKESVKNVLIKESVAVEDIFVEDFELLKNPSDFNDIYTQHIKLKFQNEIFSLEVVKGKSILESALDAGLELPYSCQTGNCRTCVATCRQGNLKMIGLSKVRQDLDKDEFLLCCSHPASANVYVEL